MKKLSDPSVTREIIKKYGFDFRKRFGQNFLVDAHVLEQIIEASRITKDDLVIEIGPGIGTLTQYLAEAAGKVVSIEIDRNLIPILEETLADYDNVTVINQDVLKTDIHELIDRYGKRDGADADGAGVDGAEVGGSEADDAGVDGVEVGGSEADDVEIDGLKGGSMEADGAAIDNAEPARDEETEPACSQARRPVRIVANLPYYITTPILMSLFKMKIPAKNITVMVQKEVADRMQAREGSKEYGSLSLAVQYYSRPHVELEVSPKSFMPRPEVWSSVICLDIYEKPALELKDEDLFQNIIKACFSQRRKTLVNSLGNASQLPFSREQIKEALKILQIDEGVRGEKLSLEQFGALTNVLAEMK